MTMDTHTNTTNIGRKVEQVRRLRGITQTELANMLGVTRQAISKMEQAEKLNDERLKEIASALGVTVEGLKKYNEETVLYNTNNRYENCSVSTNGEGNNHTFNHFPIEKTIELFEKLLDREREKFESLKKENE